MIDTAGQSPLITAAELIDSLQSADPPVLLDVRWSLLGPPGRSAYEDGHLPGAVFVDLETELAAPPGSGGRHPLPDPDELAATFRAKGVRSDSTVIVYDQSDATAAARCWWLLRWLGHPRVRVLDGGFDAWVAAGGVVATEEPRPRAGDFDGRPGSMAVVDAAGAAAVAMRGTLLDARSAERFRGEQEPIDPVAGRIPGALSAPTTANVVDGRFLDADRLRDRFAALLADRDGPVAAYCGSGVTAAHEVLALEIAGVEAALYPGSWSEWITDPTRPVATGDAPPVDHPAP